MIVIKLLVYSLLFISSPLALKKCRNEVPWTCGGINMTYNEEILRRFMEVEKDISRNFERSEAEERMVVMRHHPQAIPEFFDARQKWPQCESLSRIKNQGMCGGCWAFVSGMLTNDRLCIASGGKEQFDFSEQDMLTCCDQCYIHLKDGRCEAGANLISPLMYIIKHGVAHSECKPYEATTVQDGCRDSCDNKAASSDKKKLGEASVVVGSVAVADPSSTIEDIQVEIMEYGPIGSGLEMTPKGLTEDYTDKVYINTEAGMQKANGHSVKIIGWGTEDGVPYWLCANSWGTQWGSLGGFFKIRRGTNELGIEKIFIAIDINPKKRDEESGKRPSRYSPSSATIFTKTSLMYELAIIVVIALMNVFI